MQVKPALLLSFLFDPGEARNRGVSLQYNKDILSVQFITMRAHSITDNPSGYRGRLFPVDNSPFSPFLSLTTLFAVDANECFAEDSGRGVKKKKKG